MLRKKQATENPSSSLPLAFVRAREPLCYHKNMFPMQATAERF